MPRLGLYLKFEVHEISCASMNDKGLRVRVGFLSHPDHLPNCLIQQPNLGLLKAAQGLAGEAAIILLLWLKRTPGVAFS